MSKLLLDLKLDYSCTQISVPHGHMIDLALFCTSDLQQKEKIHIRWLYVFGICKYMWVFVILYSPLALGNVVSSLVSVGCSTLFTNSVFISAHRI